MRLLRRLASPAKSMPHDSHFLAAADHATPGATLGDMNTDYRVDGRPTLFSLRTRRRAV